MDDYSAEDLAVLAVELPDEIEKYKQYGDFTAAKEAIDRWLARLNSACVPEDVPARLCMESKDCFEVEGQLEKNPCTIKLADGVVCHSSVVMAESMKKRLLMEKRILEGLRVNFPYTEDEAIALMREKVPDFERKDLIRLDQEGLAEWIFVDGQKHYIHNFIRNVTQEDPEMVRRIAGENAEEPKDEPAGSGSMEEQKRDLSETEFVQAGKAEGTAMGDSTQVRKSERWMYPMKAPVEPSWREALRSERDRMCEEGGSQWRFRLRTSIRLKDEWFYPGIHLRAHLPIPAELYQTSDVKILAHSGGTVHIDQPDSLYRSICLEDTLEQNREFFVEYEYTVTMKYHDLSAIKQLSSFSNADEAGERFHFDAELVKEGAAVACRGPVAPSVEEKDSYLEDFTPYLQEEYPQIRFTPYLRALAQEITATVPCGQDSQKGEDVSAQAECGSAPSSRSADIPARADCFNYRSTLCEGNIPHEEWDATRRGHIPHEEWDATRRKENSGTALAKAWAIYDYITKNVRYSFMREYYLIPDIPQYCARNLRGDCGVQAMLFITLCRICEIPAKWQSGLYLAGETVGLHDWAMFYVEPYGWLYADLSFGGSAWREELKSDTEEVETLSAPLRSALNEHPLDVQRPSFGRRQNAPSIKKNATHLDGAQKEKAEARRRFYFGNLDPFRMAANNAFGQAFAVSKRFFPADPYDNQQGELESDERGFCSRDVETQKTLVMAERISDSEQLSDYAWLIPYAEGLLDEAAKCNPGPWVAHSRNVARAARMVAEKCSGHKSSLREGNIPYEVWDARAPQSKIGGISRRGRSCCDLTLDPERAYISGLLHDIGRRFGVSQLAHVYDGYHYLMDLGFPEFARIALTHSFNLGHLEDYIGEFDISEEKQQELRQLLDGIEFDDYDYLIQYCDSIATADGIVSMEERMNDVKKRYGYYPQEKWERSLELQDYFDVKMQG